MKDHDAGERFDEVQYLEEKGDAGSEAHPAGKIDALRYSKVGARTLTLAGLALTAWQAAGAPTHTAGSMY